MFWTMETVDFRPGGVFRVLLVEEAELDHMVYAGIPLCGIGQYNGCEEETKIDLRDCKIGIWT